jgi:hypothetical protein
MSTGRKRPREDEALFVVESVCGEARAGRMLGMETPALLSQTFMGSPPFLTEEMIKQMPALHGMALSFCDMRGISQEAASSPSLRKYLNSNAQALFLTTRDPIAFPPPMNTKQFFSMETTSGERIKVEPVGFIETVSAIRPDLFTALCDEVCPSTLSLVIFRLIQSASHACYLVTNGIEL